MASKLSDQEFKNLLELVYSNTSANDLLCVEIIKVLELDKRFIPILMVLLANSDSEEEADLRYEMIEPILLENQNWRNS